MQEQEVTCSVVRTSCPPPRGNYHMYPTSSSFSSPSSSSSSVAARACTRSFPTLSFGPSSHSSSRSSSRTTEPPLPKSPEVSCSSSETLRRKKRSEVRFCLCLTTSLTVGQNHAIYLLNMRASLSTWHGPQALFWYEPQNSWDVSTFLGGLSESLFACNRFWLSKMVVQFISHSELLALGKLAMHYLMWFQGYFISIVNSLTVDHNDLYKFFCPDPHTVSTSKSPEVIGGWCSRPYSPQLTAPCFLEPASSFPYLSTHQHCPVPPWHCVAL